MLFNLKNPVHWLATGFGAGLTPIAPGTLGTLVAVPLVWLLADLDLVAYLSLTAGLFIAGIWICGRTARDMGQHDHGGIVWDEIVGYLITMIAVPVTWYWLLLGFLLFRFFDIVKPWPIRWIDQRVAGGFGIMLDDLIAGVFAALLLHMFIWVLPVG